MAPRGIRNPPASHPRSPGFWHTDYWKALNDWGQTCEGVRVGGAVLEASAYSQSSWPLPPPPPVLGLLWGQAGGLIFLLPLPSL